MSDLYILCRSARVADLSAALHELKRPPQVRSSGDVARYLFAWHDHPDGIWSVLQVPAELEIPIHTEADGALLASTLEVFVQDGALTPEEFGTLTSTVPALAGQSVRVADLVPPSWAPYVFDRDTAAAQGFLPAAED